MELFIASTLGVFFRVAPLCPLPPRRPPSGVGARGRAECAAESPQRSREGPCGCPWSVALSWALDLSSGARYSAAAALLRVRLHPPTHSAARQRSGTRALLFPISHHARAPFARAATHRPHASPPAPLPAHPAARDALSAELQARNAKADALAASLAAAEEHARSAEEARHLAEDARRRADDERRAADSAAAEVCDMALW